MRRSLAPSLAALALLLGLVALTPRPSHAQGTLVFYCSVDESWCRAMATTFQKETGIHVDMTRLSSG